MTAGFDAYHDGDGGVTVVYSEELMEFRAYITLDEAEELLRNLKGAIKESEEVE